MPRSVASTGSTASQASVMFEGKEYTLENAIDKGVGDLQQFLNQLQSHLRELAAMDDLSPNESDDFKMMLEYTDKADDVIDDMKKLFVDLKGVTRQILGPCPKEAREWFKAHKAKRKQNEAEREMKRQEETVRQNLARLQMSSIAEE